MAEGLFSKIKGWVIDDEEEEIDLGIPDSEFEDDED